MAENINVSSEVLNETASKIRTCNSEMDEQLNDILNQVNSLEKSWSSTASSTIRDAMNAMKPKFEQYKEVVESYAKFLVDTAQLYEETESTINTNASQFTK